MKYHLRRIFRWCILAAAAVLICFWGFRHYYHEPMRELAESLVKNATSDLMNDAVDQQMEKGSVEYDRLVYFEKDLSGKITALKTNMTQVNRLKTDILSIINEKMLSIDWSHLGIPLGSLIFPEAFSGKGPAIPIHILSIRNSDAEFFSHFSEAGINQTRQTLNMELTVDISVLILGKTDHFTVKTQVVVAETVIVGQVPDTFLQYGGNHGKQKEN